MDLPQAESIVADLLDILRRQLGMDLAMLARVEDDHLVLQVLRGDTAGFGMAAGDRLPRRALPDEVQPVIAAARNSPGDEPTGPHGATPGATPGATAGGAADGISGSTTGGTTDNDSAAGFGLPGVGAYACVPVHDGNGRLYGVLACLAHLPRPAAPERDGRFLRLMAAFLTDAVLDLQEMWTRRRRLWSQVSDVIDGGGPLVVFQPIFRLRDQTVVGLEALSRFPGMAEDPQSWYANAATVGLATELERMAFARACAILHELPESLTLTINASPSTIIAGVLDLLPAFADGRVVVEITEHEHITDDDRLLIAVELLRDRGIRIAIDDIGTGYAGLEQLLRLRPEIIKLDGVITRGIDTDPARRAIAVGLVQVAGETGGNIVAEGIETTGELATVMATGIPYGQGYLLGHPTSLAGVAGLRTHATAPVDPG
ncbi:EAL domain-containing protein [Frankia sp. AgB32]|uniref:sensor domain-containing phosphodiesterase n=1 Tax=Frankia sp. AgB32 TaxID=631119 RepID=UPI00200CBA8D|nr:EAL domain-containing protein [Frankia sp. AgB32]MCK9896497.1 EAL domain-containing protein [Frankia sp. AgB32]